MLILLGENTNIYFITLSLFSNLEQEFMKYFLTILLSFSLLINSSCKKEKDEVSVPEEPTKEFIPEEKTEVRTQTDIPKDSINKKNAVLFLTQYGKENKESKVLIKTRLGNIKIQLFEDTPMHRASFIFLAKMGYFDTTCFY